MIKIKVLLIPLYALNVLDIGLTKAFLHGFLESRIFTHLWGKFVRTVALPGVAPASVHASQIVGIGTTDENPGTFV